MKLLHVIGSMNPASGGPCQGIRNSNMELKLFGVEREAVSLDDPREPFLGTDDFPTHAMGPVTSTWKYTPKLKPWLLKNLCYFDVVIINGLWLYSSYAVWVAMRQLKKQQKQNNEAVQLPRVFVMPHGMLDPYFQRSKSRRLKAIRNWFYWHLIEKHVVNNAEALLFTCGREQQLARETFDDYQPKNEINVGYGIFRPKPYGDNMREAFLEKCPQVANKHYLLFLSRIHHKKGVDLLINAYARVLREQTSGAPVPALVIAGPGLDSAFGKRILKMVEENPQLYDCVFFTGMLLGDAKWGALYGSDAFVLPSHQENFGIAIVEALACSKPVLITKEVNIFLEIEEGKAGIIADDNEESIFSMLMQWFGLTEEERHIMGDNAGSVFEKNFDIKVASRNFLKAIS